MSLRLLSSRLCKLARIEANLVYRFASSAAVDNDSSSLRREIVDWDACQGCRRPYSTVESAQSQIDEVNDLFSEARDIIEDARDDAETVYFNDAHAEAKEAVGQCLDKYRGIVDSLSPDEKGKLQRSMGLKIEQLKAELEELDQLHA